MCARDGPVALAVPVASPADANACTTLLTRLPARLDHLRARPVTPPSPLTAAWGHPAVTLRCGVAAQADPVSATRATLSGNGPACAGQVDWYQDDVNPTAWTTRTAPRLDVHIPGQLVTADVLGDLTDALLGCG